MNSKEEVLSFLDLLDIDEEMIDTRLKSIMVRSTFENGHLANALQLLLYKDLVNVQEKTECNNTEEFDFVAKLIKLLNEDIADNVCKITTTVLGLNSTNLVSFSEHILSQILSDTDIFYKDSKSSGTEKYKTLLYLKICDSVLDATIKHGKTVSVLFVETPLEEILSSGDEPLKVHFITSTVPKLIEGLNGYDMLSRIWNHLEQMKGESRNTALKVLSSLSDYYLPVSIDGKSPKYESELVFKQKFWEVVLYGLMSDDPTLRKISVYLTKRAIDYVASLKINLNVKLLDQTLFSWIHQKQGLYRKQWDNFFILMDSLEEKQSNIVLPSLQLFDTLTKIDHCWLNCAFNLGLRHDNGQVRLKCIDHRINTYIGSDSEAVVLLEALNDFSFYDHTLDCQIIKEKIAKVLKHETNLIHILRAMPLAHWSPVPFFHISDIIANSKIVIDSKKYANISNIFIEILKTSCNIISIRDAIHLNIAHFVGNSCRSLDFREIASIYNHLQIKQLTKTNALIALLKDWQLSKEDKKELYKYVTNSYSNIQFGILYLNNHPEDIDVFMEVIFKKGKIIQDVINRQYANKMECFDDVLYILHFQNKCDIEIKQLLPNANKTVIQYIYSLLSSNVNLNTEEMKLLFVKISFMRETNVKDSMIQLYKTAVIFLQDNQADLNKMVQSLLTIDSLTHNHDFVHYFSHQMLDLKHLLELEASFEKKAVSNAQSLGRMRNVFYETHCKLVGTYLSSIIATDNILQSSHEAESVKNKNETKYVEMSQKDITNIEDTPSEETKRQYLNKSKENISQDLVIHVNKCDARTTDWKEIIDYVEKIVDCGGYGCLERILRMVNVTFKYTISYLNLTKFTSRMWKEIEELKSSNYYLPCMKEFINLITQRALISDPQFNNITILYYSKIIEYGHINNNPLYYLVHNDLLSQFIEKQNSAKKMNEYGHLVYILSEILLYCPVPRKDQRITDNLSLEIQNRFGEEYYIKKHNFNYEIQYQAINILSKIDDTYVLTALTTFIRTKIDNTFKAKFRYHGNSQIHRTLQTALQHLLHIRFLKSNLTDDQDFDWCLDLLGRMPHQSSVRITLEWHVSLHFYVKKTELDENLLTLLQSKNVPLMSQMIIIYWLAKRRMASSFEEKQFHFVMRTLLSHTMGQMFNIRLLAQYFTIKLYNAPQCMLVKPIYDTIIDVIKKTIEDNANDKHLIKLKEDYFMNDFDIVTNLTPFFIYNTLPRLCDVGSNEGVDTRIVLQMMGNIKKYVEESINPDFKEEWIKAHSLDEEFVKLDRHWNVNSKTREDLEVFRTIQKKYIPWKSMSDISVYNMEKKRESPSELIVVASLIDKLPNLGGMARTSEVFGVKTYIIDSLRHLQDRQFQGLSVSAERWIDVEEVRPGHPLKEYLKQKKAEGYSVVAAEQTSTSIKLQNFQFPRKTLLLLGHEKEGIPCDLLPIMDHCVEIPQQGFVRSLNVHVTAAIFVWEYSRQNIL